MILFEVFELHNLFEKPSGILRYHALMTLQLFTYWGNKCLMRGFHIEFRNLLPFRNRRPRYFSMDFCNINKQWFSFCTSLVYMTSHCVIRICLKSLKHFSFNVITVYIVSKKIRQPTRRSVEYIK